ncbi:putative oxidoreductase [Acidisarcina polymorpha]|uniref:Putative oxidoreductase n=1 Tax=Acidisarcina polymorpha TaxID=2211140 RepID=A0A2Z5G5C8_9BACT|nr:putative oxidoreductase [Acidisarcina polymorpha]
MLSQSGPTRIVNVSSAGQSPLNFKDLMLEHSWSGQQSYCQAKLAQIMMTFDLAEEYSADQVTINALHPASMMPTKIVVGRFSPMSTLESGVENVFRLATDDRFLGVSGKYFNELREARANAQAYDAHTRAELKRVSEQLLGDCLD